jgi:subtilisin family serine protease
MDSTGMKMESSKYGRSTRNIQMLNGDSLHQMGYQGEGMYIAVLDGGFTNVDKIPFFDSLRTYQDLDLFYDFTEADRNVFESSTHGTSVLSAMAAYSPGILVGTAPRARYVCLKTEEVRGEHRKEEYNWVAALEYADSLGVDVVNSSLGYYAFSDKRMDYTPDQLDGKTSPASRAVAHAFDRGMIILVSAGNEGDSRWKYIDIPADSPKALAIAAVFNSGKKAGFSSFGYDSIAVIKPDLAAPGVNVPVPNAYRSRLSAASGTSLAAPIMTGLVSCLWQAFPGLPNTEIVAALKASGHQADKPDRALGYGIPDFMKAYRILQAKQNELEKETSEKP